MGLDIIPTIRELQKNDAEWFNALNRALSQDLVPRNSSGIPTDLAGSIGSSTLRWLFLRIASGHWVAGDVLAMHPYDGELSPGEGWMLMDGRIVNQANYDIEHGSGHWATFIQSSLIDGKYLPNMVDMYAVGKATTAQDGSAPITTVGNPGHTIDLRHNHNWLDAKAAGTTDQTYDSSGAAINLPTTRSASFNGLQLGLGAAIETWADAYTTKSLSNGTDISQDSMEALFYLRII